MNKSLKQYLDSFKLEKPPPKPQKISEKFKNPNNVIFENWLNANLEQKNLKNHDLHLEEYEEVPEENLHPTDYRIEIEKRFHNSVINKIYTFPRIDNEISILSDNSSIDSIKNVIFYELSSQNYQNPVNTAKSTHDLTKKMSLGVNYKQFLNLLEQTIKNVNISDLKKIKMNNFFLKEKNDILTPHFVTTKHNDVVQKLENKFNLKKKNGNSLGKTKATIENLGKMNILQKTDVDNRKNNDSNSKVLDNIHNKFSKKIIKGKKLNINPRSQAISFTQSNYNQLNSPSFTINKQ